jgi:hypothetical protein
MPSTGTKCMGQIAVLIIAFKVVSNHHISAHRDKQQP